ncbi:hypothetical protein CHS0354_040102 [Potamilus streckersoni]|uniref:Uncharacterized protein n=1 Tax=Potamilus streckersoni TaxID=2493646 RepID=A0AAE0VRW3_9BIVA|nr:hypothetical protein CHS0354_040102 [Potamilus streckersoni]
MAKKAGDADRPSRLLEPPHNMPNDSELNLSNENAELLKRAIEEHGPNLFKQHSNLEAITGISYILSKSKGYIKCPSLVLYCRVKGIMPIDEVEFPKYLKVGDEEEIVYIDVREGYFMHGMYKERKFCTTDWHDKLRMGTSIRVAGGDQGTLGPIVKISKTDIGFVTCAHVILPDPWDESALQQSIGLKVY